MTPYIEVIARAGKPLNEAKWIINGSVIKLPLLQCEINMDVNGVVMIDATFYIRESPDIQFQYKGPGKFVIEASND